MPLLTRCVCDHCDGVTAPTYHHGYVVLHANNAFRDRPTYVFRTQTDASLWRSANSLQHLELREVLCETAFKWRYTTGTLKGIELADRVYYLFPDHQHPPGKDKICLAEGRRRIVESNRTHADPSIAATAPAPPA